jgi:uncharacterized RDD family membrane protein YckC
VARIFINYRRSDSQIYANSLYDWLAEHYGDDQVFKDVDTIEPGLPWEEAIERAVAAADVMLVVIGPHWLVDQSGRRRLEDPRDYVHMEIAKALERRIRVIPILVSGAQPPEPEELPDRLTALTDRQAFELSDSRMRADRMELLRRLDRVLAGGPPTPAPAPAPPPPEIAAAPARPEPPVVAAAPAEPEARKRNYASFPQRLVAALVDALVLAVPLVVLSLITESSSDKAGSVPGVSLISVAALIPVAWLYSALMESSARQATLGKSVLGIIVTDLDGKRISFGKATARYLAKLVSAVLLFIGFIVAAFSTRKQALHDIIVGTLVVVRD